MSILGILAGGLASFWIRIIRSNMILGRVGKWLMKQDDKKIGFKRYWYVQLLTCIVCLAPWISFAFCLFYILKYHPWWLYAVIGVLGSLATSNIIVELIKALRNE